MVDEVNVLFSTQNTSGTSIYNWTWINNTPSIGLSGSGSGDMNFTATNITTEPIVATITVTPTFDNEGITNMVKTRHSQLRLILRHKLISL